MSNKRQENSTNLYIKNFGKDIDESKLCQLFSSYGVITSCKVRRIKLIYMKVGFLLF